MPNEPVPAVVYEGDAKKMPVQLAPCPAAEPVRPTRSTMLIHGGGDPGSPWAQVMAEIKRAGNKTALTMVHASALAIRRDDALGLPTPRKDAIPVPAPPRPWTPPSPPSLGEVEFADKSTGRFWPVRTRHQFGRTVCFKTGSIQAGIPGPAGIETQQRHFLAPRLDGSGTRLHAGIDLFADFGDLVVAPERGTVLKMELAHYDVFRLYLKCADHVLEISGLDDRGARELGIKVGDAVEAGKPLGRVGRLSGATALLHFATYALAHGPKPIRIDDGIAPENVSGLLDPTDYLVALAATGK